MKRSILLLYFIIFSFLCSIPLTTVAQTSERKTLIDPLTVSGTLGTQVISSWNNADLHYNSPFSTVAYADMTLNVYGVSIPMTFNFINVSSKQFDFSNPNYTFSIRPTWKRFTFYFGTSCMNYSNYTYNGISYDGVGMEYRGENIRFGGFYGNFNHATTFRTALDDRDAIQFLSDSLLGMNNVAYTTLPVFKRKAYAAHLALGTTSNYLDFSLLHAADDLNSLPSQWYLYEVFSDNSIDTMLMDRDSTLQGKENLAMGLKGHFTLGEWGIFEANLGASFFTPDILRDEMVLDGTGGMAQLGNTIMGGLRKANLYNFRYGSEIRFAGDALLNMNFNPVTATFTYRFVQPNYVSLGANGFNQNAQTFGGNVSTSLFNKNAFVSLNGYLQRDNLDKKQMYTNHVGSYSINWNNFFGESIALSLMYNAVTQRQTDGVLVIPENIRIDQITHSFDFSPSYTLSLESDHTFSVNFNLLQNKNRNEKMDELFFDVLTTSYGIGYDVYLAGSGVSLDANYDYSLSRSPGNDYNSHCLSGGTSYDFIDNDDLTLSGSARLMLAYNIDKTEAEDLSDTEKQVLDYLARRVGARVDTEITNDVSVAARLGASLNYKDHHNASVFFSISNYSDNIIIGQHVAVNTDVRFMVEYSYRFASRLIKSKKIN